jgi:hypothetical protein
MNRRIATFALTALLAGTAAAAGDHKPTKGGLLVAGKEADYELVAQPTVLQLYVSDHGKPRDVTKAAARLTLLAGTEKQEVELKPAGDKLEATGNFNVAAGTKVVAVVTDGGKTLGTARFTLK